MHTARTGKLMPMPVLDALDSERWQIDSPLSLAFVSSHDQAAIHLWRFISISRINFTDSLYVCWGTRAGQEPVILAFGADNTEFALRGVMMLVFEALNASAESKYDAGMRTGYPWTKFVSEFLVPEEVDGTIINSAASNEPRTVESMLQYVQVLGHLFDETGGRAVARLSGLAFATEGDLTENTARICNAWIGAPCREQRIEPVFWPERIWSEAIEDHEIFVGSNVPAHFLPDTPQIWYFERPMSVPLDSNYPTYRWWTPDWLARCMVILPVTKEGARACTQVLLMENQSPSIADVNDALPRIVLMGFATADRPCRTDFSMVLAGLEFMQQALPGTPHVYSDQEQTMAVKQGMKLQPYSVMEVRRTERPEPSDAQDGSEESGSKHTYHYSFFQRRHRRRVKEPRKSDGVQVIRVAACQQCKHLPLKPGAKANVTKVSR